MKFFDSTSISSGCGVKTASSIYRQARVIIVGSVHRVCSIRFDSGQYTNATLDYAVVDIRLKSPVRRPGKIIAPPLNYENHVEKALEDAEIDLDD